MLPLSPQPPPLEGGDVYLKSFVKVIVGHRTGSLSNLLDSRARSLLHFCPETAGQAERGSPEVTREGMPYTLFFV